jgi:hypothetical protein
MIERLPQFAERHFASLCAAAGVVCNRSEEDELGWDFLLQFPARRTPGRPADMEPAGPEAFVQVKSTRSRPLLARTKLSNALNAAQSTRPFFIVLITPGGSGPHAYAKHFWEAEIARALRRVRLAERAGDVTFNKRSFDIGLTQADAQADLLAWMRETIESVTPSYGAEKTRIATTVGHEDGFGLMDVSLEGNAADLLDLHLGLIDSLPIRRASYVPQRFGIAAAKPELELENAQMHIEPVSKPVRLRLQGGSPTRELVVDAKLYNALLPAGAEPRHRWRVDAGPLRIVGGSGSYQARLTTSYDRRLPLSGLRLFTTLAAWSRAGAVGLQLFLDDQRIPLGTLTFEEDEASETRFKLKEWTDALSAVAQASQATEPAISLAEIRQAAPFLSRFAAFVGSASIRMDYEPEGIDDPTRAAVYFVACDVGEFCFLVVIERNTRSDEMIGSRRSLTFGEPKILDAISCRGSWRDHLAEIESAYRAQVDRLGDPDTLWEMGDLEEFISRVTAAAA